jgi:hypothetical protein
MLQQFVTEQLPCILALEALGIGRRDEVIVLR